MERGKADTAFHLPDLCDLRMDTYIGLRNCVVV